MRGEAACMRLGGAWSYLHERWGCMHEIGRCVELPA